jgi:hypothetical protein
MGVTFYQTVWGRFDKVIAKTTGKQQRLEFVGLLTDASHRVDGKLPNHY